MGGKKNPITKNQKKGKNMNKTPSINFRNVLIGIVLVVACVYIGANGTLPHRNEIVTGIVNIPSNLDESQQHFTEHDVVYNSQAGISAVDMLNNTLVKVIIISSIAGFVFALISMTGLSPRFGGMGD
jgi:hypothetical protein